MSWNITEPRSNQTNTSDKFDFYDFVRKPIEMYVFIDPLCPESWSLEPYLKKLSIEYGRFFTIRPIICGHMDVLNKSKFGTPMKLKDIWEKTAKRTGMSCDGDIWIENPISDPLIASLAVKAAELQGKKAGRIFLRKLQEYLFLKKQNISEEKVLIECAEKANLDVSEFEEDLYSSSAKKALQCDLKLTKEMDIDYVPTIVFFNQKIEDHGIKISGLYPYDIYVRVLKQMLERDASPAKKPSLEDFMEFFKVVGQKEISVVFDWTETETEKEMKMLQIKQQVMKVPVKFGTFWKYIG